jgi:GT2 family glycosyltransferase
MSRSISVICVTHGRPQILRRCLESCARQNYPGLKFLVVTNPPDGESEVVVEQVTPSARIIRTQTNIGFFPALNLALTEADTDYVMVVDDDAYFITDDSLSRLVDKFAQEPDLGAVTCTLEGPYEAPGDSRDKYISVFTTGFTMLPRKVFSEWIGAFPNLFFRSAGETFWCTELWEQGRPVKRVADVRMFHALAKEGRSTKDWRFHGLRSQLLCAVMREPAAWLPVVLASKFFKSFWQYLKYGQPLLWIKAWASFLIHIDDAFRLRKPISMRTRRLIRRLNRTPVYNLSNLPEWKGIKMPQKRSPAELGARAF